MTPAVRFGVDRLCDDRSLLGEVRRVGLVTNDAARLARNATEHSRVALIGTGVPIVRLFGAEHGLTATAADGAAVEDGVDTLTGLDVVSLYGERMRPDAESIRDLDAVLFDVPDVGARFYTYTWTLFHMLAACAESGVPLMVLDRPNPLGGELTICEGPLLDSAFRSFIGEDTIPIRHQLTLGELARLWQQERFPSAPLRVIACSGWRRDMLWRETGLTWVPTSPAMPSGESALLYPGTCLFESTNLNVGRGTEAPFQLVGAPWLDVARVIDAVREFEVPGVRFEQDSFTPNVAPYAGIGCAGVRLVTTHARLVRPVALGLTLLAIIARLHRRNFDWARYPTAANPAGEGHFERLFGRGEVREILSDTHTEVSTVMVHEWTTAPGWTERVRIALIYN